MTLILVLAGVALFLVAVLGVAVFLLLRSRGGDSNDAPPMEKKKLKKVAAKKAATAPEPAAQSGTNNRSAAPPPPQPAQATPASSTGPSPQPIVDSATEQIRILIVDDNPGTRDNVTRLLYFENDMEVIGQAVNGRQGIDMAKEFKPHIVLMDINMPDMDGITATKEMAMQTPFSQVVIMSVQSDQHYMKQAMAAGARDFQPKPFTSDELVSCLRRVYNVGKPMYRQYEAAQQAKTMKPVATSSGDEGDNGPIIAVYSPKGGVGASALAANLGVALQQQLGDVVLVDGAFQFGDILVHLNTRPVRTISDLIHDGNLEIDLLPDVVLPHESGLKLLLAPTQPQLADFITVPIIKEVLNGLKTQYNAVVVDTTGQLHDRTLTILDQADMILLVAVPELPSIKSIKLFLEVAEQLDFNLDKIKVVINRFNIPGGIRPEKLEQVLNLKETYRVPYDPKLYIALTKGTSINQHSPSAPSAVAIRDIARHISQTVPQQTPEVEAA